MEARTIRLALPTGRRVEVRADLSLRVMLRTGLIQPADDLVLIDLLDGVLLDDREQARRLQDALVMHCLDASDSAALHGLSDADFAMLLDYAARAMTGQAAVEDDEAEVEDDAVAEEEVLGVTDAVDASPAEPSLEDELERARSERLPEVKVPTSAEVLTRMEAERAE